METRHWIALLPLALVSLFLASLALVFSTGAGFVHTMDPVFLEIGSFQIRWYGLFYFSGFVGVYLVLWHEIRRKRLTLERGELDTFILFLVPAVVFGARVFEILVYNPGYYFEEPARMIRIWEGGLSFHGSLAGVIGYCLLFARWKKIPFLRLTDILVPIAALALALGRFGNFINGELYGAETALPWGVKFSDAAGFRHPVQIYEMGKNLLIFGTVFFVKSLRVREGVVSFLFLVLYGTIRFFLEFLKDYEEYEYVTLSLAGLNVAQLLCLIMVIAGVIGLARLLKRPRGRQPGT